MIPRNNLEGQFFWEKSKHELCIRGFWNKFDINISPANSQRIGKIYVEKVFFDEKSQKAEKSKSALSRLRKKCLYEQETGEKVFNFDVPNRKQYIYNNRLKKEQYFSFLKNPFDKGSLMVCQVISVKCKA